MSEEKKWEKKQREHAAYQSNGLYEMLLIAQKNEFGDVQAKIKESIDRITADFTHAISDEYLIEFMRIGIQMVDCMDAKALNFKKETCKPSPITNNE